MRDFFKTMLRGRVGRLLDAQVFGNRVGTSNRVTALRSRCLHHRIGTDPKYRRTAAQTDVMQSAPTTVRECASRLSSRLSPKPVAHVRTLTRFGLVVETQEQRKEKILAGVMASVYRQVPQSVLVSIVGAFALVVVFWNSMSQNLLMGWFVLILLESLIRVRVAYRFRHASAVVDQVQRWATRWVVLAVTAGLLWGVAGFLFFSNDQPLHQVVLVAVVLSVAFGSLTLYACYRPSFYAFMLLALLPLIGRMVWEQDPTYYTASVVMAAVFFFTVFYGRTFGDAVFESVKNNYENEVLVEQLLNEKRLAEEARRDAENATRSKTQFFAAASHDLRQPLQAIGIYVSLLKKRAQGPIEPLVNNLSTAVESLSKLVEELLEISRLDSGAIQPRVDQVLLDDLFTLLEQEFTPLSASKGLSLRVRRSGFAIDSDPLLLQRVIRNLLANAIRYTQRGGVLLAARPRSGLISLEIWDTGPGIRQGELDRIFEEFYRGESSKAENSGAGFGLGLSIVKRICGLLGHPLIVTTRPGTGTVFRVEVPVSIAPLRAKRTAPETIDVAIRDAQRLHVRRARRQRRDPEQPDAPAAFVGRGGRAVDRLQRAADQAHQHARTDRRDHRRPQPRAALDQRCRGGVQDP